MIKKLLIANRGEIARRIIRSARPMGIACVAVCSDPDARAPHVTDADEVVRLAGSTPRETYLDVDAVMAAAVSSGADAVHPGYGFLSEHAGFARACVAAGLTFVGPPPDVIEAMGSKLSAKALMAEAGVPVLPTVEIPRQARRGTGSGAVVYREVLESVGPLGWPLLVKASAGGGGRGMRVVEGPDTLLEAMDSAVREATSAFGDGTVFIEPYVPRARHVEVQIFGDLHGNVVHLFERECSIQRRHQKIVEESPSPAVDAELRARLGAAAVTAAKTIGYVNAGTVEFLLTGDGNFAFLEVNTRLQVEHPVTEFVTGLDLVRLQLLVADGAPLGPEVTGASQTGHAIEVRLYAEDATRDWQPSAGTLHRFDVPTITVGPVQVRVDSGVEDGSEVSSFYDPMLAKVISYAPTRHEAAQVLASTLARAQLHGVTTNRDLLVRILRDEEFLSGDIDTAYLQRHDPALLGAPLADAPSEQLHAVAAALAAQAERRVSATVVGGVPSGFRNNPAALQSIEYRGHHGVVKVGYRFDRTGRCTTVWVNGTERLDIVVDSASPHRVELRCGGVTRPYEARRLAGRSWVDGPEGSTVLDEIERFPLVGNELAQGSLVAPLPGTVVNVAVVVGSRVQIGDTLMAIEAMKMEHEIRAPTAGVVTEIDVAPGDQVDTGRVLVVIDDSGSSGGSGDAPS